MIGAPFIFHKQCHCGRYGEWIGRRCPTCQEATSDG